MCGNFLNLRALGDDLRSCSLKMSIKLFKLIFSISAQNHCEFSDFSENSCAGMAIFAISLLLLMIFLIIWVFLSESGEYLMYSVPVVNTKDKNVEFLDYSGFSFRIWQIIDVFAVCSEPCCIL